MKMIRVFPTLACLMLFGISVFPQMSREDGMDLYRQGKYDQAIKVFDILLSKNKGDRIAWVYLGASLLRNGNTALALMAFQNGRTSSKDELEGYEKRVEIIAKPRAGFPHPEILPNGLTRVVRLAVEFLADGHLGFIVPVAEREDGFTRSSVAAAKHIKFNPARKDGKPVTMVLIVEYSFTMY